MSFWPPETRRCPSVENANEKIERTGPFHSRSALPEAISQRRIVGAWFRFVDENAEANNLPSGEMAKQLHVVSGSPRNRRSSLPLATSQSLTSERGGVVSRSKTLVEARPLPSGVNARMNAP